MPDAIRHQAVRTPPLFFRVAPWSASAFAIAIACVALATLARYGLEAVAPDLDDFATYFSAVLVTTLIGGTPAGLFAVVLGGVCASWFILEANFSPESDTINYALYLIVSLLTVWCAQSFRDLYWRLNNERQKLNQHLALITDQNEILSQIVTGAPLHDILTKLLRSIESYSNFEMLGSILLMDSDGLHLRHPAAPSLPEGYCAAIDGEQIGPSAGSCGTAAYRKAPVIVADIATDPLWTQWRSLALEHGLRACWSIPIMSEGSKVLGTFAIYYRTPRHPTADEMDIISFMTRTAAVAIESDRQAAHTRLLLNELNHRIKNTLATVQSIASLTVRHKIASPLWQDLEARLVGFSRTHDLLVRERWESVDLRDLVAQTVLQPFLTAEGRIRVEGPSLRLAPHLALPIAMALHELCTNAVKYGALSNAAGVVSLVWQATRDADGSQILNLHWTESDGPPVAPPKRKGFGTQLFERALAAELGGASMLDYRPEGLRWNAKVQLAAPADAAPSPRLDAVSEPVFEKELARLP